MYPHVPDKLNVNTNIKLVRVFVEKLMVIRVIMNYKIDKFKYYGVSKHERGGIND